MSEIIQPLSNTQLEILKTFSYKLTKKNYQSDHALGK